MSQLMGVSPLLLLVAAGLAIMLVDGFTKERAELASVTAVSLFVAAALAGTMLASGNVAPAPDVITRYLAVDQLALFFDVVICVGAGLSVLLAGGYLREHGFERGEFYVLILFTAFGAMVLARAVDLLSIFLGLETMSLGAYALVAYRRTSARAVEGAVKYFLLGSFAAAILLFGSALLYGATGHTDLAGIGQVVAAGQADATLTVLALVMLIVGLAFKLGAVPFHMWVPDAYEGAVTPVTTFMSVGIKAAAVAVLLRVLVGAFGDPASMGLYTGWTPVIMLLAVITMVYGNLAALAQTSVKRMLAYSSVAHAGYILVGLAAVHEVGSFAVSSVLYYIAAYTFSNVLAFGSLILMGSKGKEAVSYDDLAGAGRRHPVAAFPFVIGVLSLLGMPPTAGFFGKYYVFSAAVQAGGPMIWVAVIGVLASAVGAYYYLKVIVYLFMREPEEDQPIAVPMRSMYVTVTLVLAGYYVVKMGITPSRYLDWAVSAASSLVG
ncbi:MAG: NADH-quinone oxidoreductase subunit N [Deltaproteobacteria bacterium]|nr:NADH-quinone oxidoreductase subunit N [Deltaproteobacteria bacterium]MBW2545768.1 NADH-quinone oxidoreductase subunit N [Deltaproteobacteria bacterium]RLB51095.1 MAG: NADH-quinone oxidoreductase subunit N [Deltaproteobacteria bacterium]